MNFKKIQIKGSILESLLYFKSLCSNSGEKKAVTLNQVSADIRVGAVSKGNREHLERSIHISFFFVHVTLSFSLLLLFAGFWTFLYFVSFCFLANQWSRTTADELPLNQGADAARAAIAFSFFSIITWVRADAAVFWTVAL